MKPQATMPLTKLFVSVKPGDQIRIGTSVLHVLEKSAEQTIKLQIQAPSNVLIEFIRPRQQS